MHWSARIVSSLTSDTEPSLAIISESPPAKYLFNVGEGFTRSSGQTKFGLAKTKAIFLTRINPQRSGGLPGALMSLADMNTAELHLCGPPGLTHYIASMRHYVMRTNMLVNLSESAIPDASTPSQRPDPIFKDDILSVYGIQLLPSGYVNPPEASTTSSSPGVKRHRSASPNSGTKRLKTDSPHSKSSSRDDNIIPDQPHLHRQKVVAEMFRKPGEAAKYTPDADPYTEIDRPMATFSSQRSKLLNQTLPNASPSVVTTCYLGVGPSLRGRFDPAKATALKVPKGPLWSALTKGQTVSNANGEMITPDMCVGPSSPPAAFLFIDCPDLTYLESLLKSKDFDLAQYGEDGEPINLRLVVHRLGNGVLEDPRYKEWMRLLGSEAHHLIANERYSPSPVVFTSPAHYQLCLSELDEKIFQIPHEFVEPEAKLSGIAELPANTQVLQPGMLLAMTLPKGLEFHTSASVEDKFHPLLEQKLTGTFRPPLSDIYDEVKKDVIERSENTDTMPGGDVVLTPLGTGSALPSKYRNVSSTLVQIPNYGNILLDCGEGTWGQMTRRFGPQLESVLRNLRCVFISHIHGDHHIGLSKLLLKRREICPEEPIHLILNDATLQYLQEFNELCDIGLDLPTTRIIKSRSIFWKSTREQMLNGPAKEHVLSLEDALGLASIQTVNVIHRSQSYGLVIRHTSGWSLVFSGDTMPCKDLISAGRGATVLIHEATMADDQVDQARAKAHSTFSQAIDVGKRMNAKNILLTHFSQRYPKSPVLPSATHDSAIPTSASNTPNVALAFDCASMRIDEIWKMHRYQEALAKTFENPVDGEDDEVQAEGVTESVEEKMGKGKKGEAQKRKGKGKR